MYKIVITGSSGLIGSRVIKLLQDDFIFIPLTHQQVDIIDKIQIANKLKEIDFDLLLHLAAYTNVDQAEKEKELARQINVEGTKNLFEVAKEKGKKFVYISTDFVFDGQNPPYYEESKPNPISYYGQTKYEAEKIVENDAMIVRTSYPYCANFKKKKDFVQSIRSQLKENKPLTTITNSLITPTFIDDLVYSLKYLISNYSEEIFHIVGSDSLSPYTSSKAIAKIFGLNPELIQPIDYKRYFLNKAKRPKFSEIKSKKNNFYKMHTFEEGLQEVKKQLL